MTKISDGPLTNLMGSWEDEKDVDMSPQSEGKENSG